MILVSIIIPIYNQERFLPNCLISLERQTLLNKEIILVNDGSTDNSQNIIDDFCKRHQDWNIIVVKRPNGGLSAARNSGIKESNGKYLYFLDADDSISDNCLTDLSDLAESQSADMVMGENNIIKDGKVIYNKLRYDDILIVGNQKVLDYYTKRLWYNVAWNKLVKAEIIKSNQLFFSEGNIFEDNLWTFQLATYIETLGAVHLPTYNYYIRTGSQSIMQNNADKSKKWLRYIPILKEMSNFIRSKSLNESITINDFFMQELNHVIYGLYNCGELSKEKFDELKKLCDVNLMDSYRNKLIGRNELIAYFFYNLPSVFDYLYFRLMDYCIKAKKQIV